MKKMYGLFSYRNGLQFRGIAGNSKQDLLDYLKNNHLDPHPVNGWFDILPIYIVDGNTKKQEYTLLPEGVTDKNISCYS